MDLRLLIVLLVRQDPSTKKRSNPPDVAVFVCLSLLLRPVGRSHLTNVMKDLLNPMLAVGLSPALTTCLRELATSIPVLKRDIAEGLLKMLSLVLMHQPLRHPGNYYFIIVSLLFQAISGSDDVTGRFLEPGIASLQASKAAMPSNEILIEILYLDRVRDAQARGGESRRLAADTIRPGRCQQHRPGAQDAGQFRLPRSAIDPQLDNIPAKVKHC